MTAQLSEVPFEAIASMLPIRTEPPLVILRDDREQTSLAIGSPAGANVAQRFLVARQIADSFWLAGDDLIQPVLAQIQVDGDDLLATEPVTGIYGVGSDLAEAVNDLRSALRDHFVVLNDESSSLSDDLRIQRDWLRVHLRHDG